MVDIKNLLKNIVIWYSIIVTIIIFLASITIRENGAFFAGFVLWFFLMSPIIIGYFIIKNREANKLAHRERVRMSIIKDESYHGAKGVKKAFEEDKDR